MSSNKISLHLCRDLVGEDVESGPTPIHRPGPSQHCSQVSTCPLGPDKSTVCRQRYARLLQKHPTGGSDPLGGEDMPLPLRQSEKEPVLRVAQTGYQEK